MINVEVAVEGADRIINALSGLHSQIPFAVSNGLNRVVNVAQQAIRERLPQHFTLRRKQFIERTIYRARDDFATKGKLEAAVRVHPERDFLAKFEDQHRKQARQGQLAVPVVRARNKSLLITRSHELHLARVMALIDAQGGKAVGPHRRGRRHRAARQSFFVVHSRKGHTVILQRDGATVRPIYAFYQSVPIEPDLEFVQTAHRAVERNWERCMDEALAHAIATMR